MSHIVQSAPALMPRRAGPKAALAVVIASLFVVGSAVPSLAFTTARGANLAGAKPAMGQTSDIGYRGYRNVNAPRNPIYRGQAYRGGPGWRYGGAAIGAGAAGLAAGAFLGDAMATSAEPVDEAVSYCANRFKSYDPSTGTYLGYDGDEHPCP